MLLNRNIGFIENKITRKLFFLYLALYITLFPLVISSIENFIDYESYDTIIKGGWAWLLYPTEPISAFLLSTLHKFSLGAFELYLFTWCLAFIFFVTILFKMGKSFSVLYLYLILNPIALILLQFSRQYLSYLFFLIALFFLVSRPKSYLFLLLSSLSHTASALFSIFFFTLLKSRFLFFFFYTIIAILGFYILSTIFFDVYTVHDTEQGRGRVIITLLSFILFTLLSIKRTKIFISLILLAVFLVFSFAVSPQAGRFAPYFIALLAFYGFYSFRGNSSIIVIHIFFIINVAISLFIVSQGLYGFG